MTVRAEDRLESITFRLRRQDALGLIRHIAEALTTCDVIDLHWERGCIPPLEIWDGAPSFAEQQDADVKLFGAVEASPHQIVLSDR